MSTTFKFEELDEATHDYLVAVRESGGRGSPGVFIETSDSLPGCGCIMGPIIIIAVLLLTLIPGVGIIYDDPVRVAMLQTAGLVLGGWLLVAGFRGSKGSSKYAGNWVYVDPLYLYQAFREQITITPVDDIIEARTTHNYNNGNYQNSVLNIMLGGREVVNLTLNNEDRAEVMRIYLNYLAWARGDEGGERANLAPATLGGLAKYVAKHGDEPLDAESNVNLNMIELDITEVPEEPIREGRAVPAVLPYILVLVFGTVAFFLMAYVVNPPLRDDAIYEAVTKHSIEPRYLRAYLTDPRNKLHRKVATDRLSQFYNDPIEHVKQHGKDPELRDGMAKVLESVRTAEQPVVSMRVTEMNTPAGKEAGKAEREKNLRTQLVNAINGEFSKQRWGQPVQPPPGIVFKETPPPVGQQLLAFIEPPEGADKVHFDITYTLSPTEFGQYNVTVSVEMRTNINEPPVARQQYTMNDKVSGANLDSDISKIAKDIATKMVGDTPAPAGMPGPVPIIR